MTVLRLIPSRSPRMRYPGREPVCLAFDDTKLKKSGRKIKSAFWQRDPLSPPFHVNFLCGLRFMHASLIFPHYRDGDFSARGYPVRFVECPAVKKPGKKATRREAREPRPFLVLRKAETPLLGLAPAPRP